MSLLKRSAAVISASILSVFCIASPSASAAPGDAAPPLKCERGPINRMFGGAEWLVYGCADGRSIVVVSAPGSPAFPFYFMVFAGTNGYEVVGEGTGRKEATAAAFSELKALSGEEVGALVAESSRVPKQRKW